MAGYFKSVENYKDPYTIVDFAVDYNTPPKYKGMSSIKGRATRDSKDNPKNWDLNNLDGEQVERLTAMMYTISKILIGHIVTKFIDIELSRIATAMIVRKPSNEKMYQFISKSIDEIYKKDPKLHAIPLDKFKKTGLINYNMSNFRERSLDDVLMQVKSVGVQTAIQTLVKLLFPIPFSWMVAFPIEMMLTYIGIDIGYGSLYNMLVELEGNSIVLGVSYVREGFKLSNLVLYCEGDKEKVYRKKLPDPPRSSYKLTVHDAKKILQEYTDKNDAKFKKAIKDVTKHHAFA